MSSDVRTARHGAEDGFHEIQLSGKQLVFLFMATTIVSIVIFLCGVLVGRGARVDALPAEIVDAAVPQDPGTLAPSSGDPVVNSSPPAASADPGKPTKVESSDFNYMEMLTAEQSKNEVPQPPAEAAADAGAPTATAVPPSAPAADLPAAATVAEATPAAKPAAAGGLTIQVAAVKDRAEADRIATRLQARGYEAYVAEPTAGAAMYRVRVGHFGDRADADKVASRLAKEEKFRPWVTR
jgi:cell division septation protein DedD